MTVNNVYRAGQHKEIIAQAVDPSQYCGIDSDSVGVKSYDTALGTSSHCAGDLCACGIRMSSGQNEAVVARQGRVEGIDIGFKGIDG